MSQYAPVTRRAALGVGLGAAAALTVPAAAAGKTLIYISAANCPYCAQFESNGGLAEMKALAAARGMPVRQVYLNRFQSYQLGPWPADLNFILERHASGTPRYLIVSGQSILTTAFGTGGYRKTIKPLLS